MTIRKILLYAQQPTALRKTSKPVKRAGADIQALVQNLKDTLLAQPDGIGLAAPQIHVHLRVVVVRLGTHSDGDNQAGPPIALINPKIIEAGDERKDFDGCLSFPGLYGETIRPHYLRVTGLAENGKPFDQIYQGFDAVVVHHEIDHLDGVLFIDRIENPEDLYRVQINDQGEFVRISAGIDPDILGRL